MSAWLERLVAIGVLLMLVGTACASDGSSVASSQPESTPPESTPPATASDFGSAAAPSGQPLVEGLTQVEVVGPPESGAGEVPLFGWKRVDGAATYDLVVLGPDGPLWAWQGAETEIRLGALPFERPPGMGGPVIVAGSCWSVIALDAVGHVVAASDFLPISPDESDGHVCVPGLGADEV